MKKPGRKKKLLMIVHGAWKINFKKKFINNAEMKLASLLTSSRSIKRQDYHRLAEFLGDSYDEIRFFRWGGGLFSHDDEIARLAKDIKKCSEYQTDILTASLGGKIVSETLAKSPNIKINKLLYIGAVHKGKPILNNVKEIINVYSKIDNMFFFANDVYEGVGNAVLGGKNVINIVLDNIRHDWLLLNKPIKHKNYKARHLYDLYKYVLVGK